MFICTYAYNMSNEPNMYISIYICVCVCVIVCVFISLLLILYIHVNSVAYHIVK